MANTKKTVFKILKILGKIILGILIFLLLVILFIRSPWGQNIIKDKFINSISKKTGTEIRLDRIFVQFNGDIQVDNLYVEDQKGDTLIYSESLNADIPFLPIIKGNSFSLNSLEWKNAKARIYREDSISGFNYEFLLEAMAASDTTASSTPADTTASPMKIDLGDFNLQDIDLSYRDEVTGIDTKANFKQLQASFLETDLEQMNFRLKEVLLSDANVAFYQTRNVPSSNEEETPLPILGVENLKLQRVKAQYASVGDTIQAGININDFSVADADFNLKDSIIGISSIDLKNSAIDLEMKSPSATTQNTPENTNFEWPGWKIDISETNLENNHFGYVVDDAIASAEFNPNYIVLDSLDFSSNQIAYERGQAQLKVEKLHLREASGLAVQELQFEALLSNTEMKLQDLTAAINSNRLAGNAQLQFADINDLINKPETASLQANLSNIRLQLREIYRFQPDLRNNEYFRAVASAPVSGAIRINGKLDNLSVNPVNLNWRNTRINGSGTLLNATDPDRLAFNFPKVDFRTHRNDLLYFVKESDLGISLPEDMRLQGSFRGNTTDISTTSNLVTSEGSVAIDGTFTSGEKLAFDSTIQGDSIALGKLLQNEALGNMDITIKATGSGSNVENLNADLNSRISSFTYNGYQFENIDINGKLENGKGPVNLIYQDANLDMEAQTTVRLDSVSPRMDFTIYLDGADLGALGITQQTIKTGFTLEGWYEGNASQYEVEADIIDGVAVYNNKTYLLGSFESHAFVTEDTTAVNIKNRILNLDLQSNASPIAFTQAINRHFKRYVTENYQEDSIINPVNLKLNAKISEAPILNKVFIPNLEELDTVNIDVDFREKDRELDAFVDLPSVKYMGSQIDSLKLEMFSDNTDLNFDFGFKALTAGPLAIKRTQLDGGVVNRKLQLEFSSMYENDTLAHVNSELNFQGDTLKFHVEPNRLILNKNPWNIADNNLISYDTGYLHFQDFRLFRNGQEMMVSNNAPESDKESLKLAFNNFKLAALLNYLNPENQLAQGNLNGEVVLEEPFGETGLLADMQINQFRVMEVDLNTLSLKGNSAGFNNYDFEMMLKGGAVDLDLTGAYVAAEPSAELDMNLDINEFQMQALKGFTLGAVKDGSGSFSGNIKLQGTVVEPEYSGNLQFNQASFNVAMLNSEFNLPNETLRIDTNGAYFDNFNIQDSNGNAFVLNGEIITESLLNPGFNLDLQAKNFQLLNSTEEDNDLFYGKAIVDVDAKITGDLNLPIVNADLTINENTDFTYVIPETEMQIKDRDGVVIFVNKENPDDILTQTEEESYVVSGYDIYTRVRVDEDAVFRVILNESTGDKFQVQGEGDLIYNMYPNGRMSLSGVYDINDGFYEMSLYNLVKRRFDIADGSRVSWSGDPFDAKMDVRAIYRVETSASSLMATRISGMAPQEQGSFKNDYPFLVYLNVDGELTEPKITFSLDMPQDEQGAGGGQIYGQIQQLNNQEAELNKQVFSLLVLNRFFPSSSSGAEGGTLAVARDNLNNALSDQLNMLSSRILGDSGVQLNFDVDSFTDYQGETPEDRTQLNINAQKAFMEDRLVVQVGSEVDIQGGNTPGQESSPLIGTVSIAYLLDEQGVWRIKGFRRNQFENVIDGQLIISGISLIFTKEFNKFKELFEKAVVEEANKQQENKKEQEAEAASNNDKATRDEEN
ncbi:MAG: translocation/assembly module TamB domain-containing protein [Christiangramia sp.]